MSDVEQLNSALSGMPNDMLDISRSLRCLFAVQLPGTGIVANGRESSEAAAAYVAHRDAVHKDATVYANGVLPLAEDLVTNIMAHFRTYEALSQERWISMLGAIVSDLEGYEKSCFFLYQLHVKMMTELKTRQVDALKSIQKMRNVSNDLKESAANLEKRAELASDLANLVRVAGIVAAPVTLGMSVIAGLVIGAKMDEEASDERYAARRAEAEAEIVIKVAELSIEKLIPAIESFLKSMGICMAFFSTTKADLQMTRQWGEAVNADNATLHFDMMKDSAPRISEACRKFLGTIGEVRSDVNSIRTELPDRDYVDQWLKAERLAYERARGPLPIGILRALGLPSLMAGLGGTSIMRTEQHVDQWLDAARLAVEQGQ